MDRLKPHHYLAALLASFLLVLATGRFTNRAVPIWDSLRYLEMARNGVIDNPGLVAPFAYRPGMPLAAALFSRLFNLPAETGFIVTGYLAILAFLLLAFLLARRISGSTPSALAVTLIMGLSFTHVKYPLFFFSMVDVSAYPFILLAFILLLSEQHLLCLAVSLVGLLFKEFLLIPLALTLLLTASKFRRERTAAPALIAAAAAVLGPLFFLLPRLLIPVARSVQEIDPLHSPDSLSRLWLLPLDPARDFNILFSTLSYWLPALLLLNRPRLFALAADLKPFRAIIIVYLSLTLILTLYGGTNVFIFVSYSAPVLIMVLALLLKQSPHPLEIAWLFIAMVIFHKTWSPIPLPQTDINGYLDFYGGWASRVNEATIHRSLLMLGLMLVSAAIRRLIVFVPRRRPSSS